MTNTATFYTTISIDGHAPIEAKIMREQEFDTVYSSTATKPDKAWRFTDAFGHDHQWAEVNGRWTVPTATEHLEERPCPGGCGDPGCEGITVRIWECQACGIEIEPRVVPDNAPISIAGPIRLYAKLRGWPMPKRSFDVTELEKPLPVIVYVDGREYLKGEGHPRFDEVWNSDGRPVEVEVDIRKPMFVR